jgi:hypothetical protein
VEGPVTRSQKDQGGTKPCSLGGEGEGDGSGPLDSCDRQGASDGIKDEGEDWVANETSVHGRFLAATKRKRPSRLLPQESDQARPDGVIYFTHTTRKKASMGRKNSGDYFRN